MAKAAISFEKRDESAQMSLVYYFEREYSNNEKNTLKMLCFFKIFFCSFFFYLLHQNMILFSSPGELLQILECLSEIDLAAKILGSGECDIVNW